MKLNCSRQEIFLVSLACILGVFLRIRHTEVLAVEHFDEGVYSAGLWHDAAIGTPYPMRHLYAPPLLPKLIEVCSLIPGLEQTAPFAPSILLGCLSVPLLWWLARSWFGMNAGLFAVYILAFSDFHITFSRMALTDAPVLFWILLATGLAAYGLDRRSLRLIASAGVATGIAWWTKYTGWLPLAIAWSGGIFWWLTAGRRTTNLITVLKLLAVMTLVAFAVWLPWLIALQDLGGYSAVSANHRNYMSGFHAWQNNMASHIMYHFHFDSWMGAAAILLGMMAAGTRRWIELSQSFWGTQDRALSQNRSSARDGFPPPVVLGRLIGAAVVMGVIATGISSFGLLTCLAIGGMAGAFLWPTLSELYRRKVENDLSPPSSAAHHYSGVDLNSSSLIDPRIGTCFAVAWFLGMVVSAPLYQPFPRLSLTLFASVVLAASGGVAWWIEATFNVARRGRLPQDSRQTAFMKKAVMGMVVASVAIILMTNNGLRQPAIWQNRTSLRDAAWHLSQTVVLDADGKYQKTLVPLNTDESGMITPDPSDSDASPIEQLLAKVSRPFDTSTRLADPKDPHCVVYAYGEPAALTHVNAAGVIGIPVQDFDIDTAMVKRKHLPTYLILGPNAIRSDGVLNEWAAVQHRFSHVADFHFAPGAVVLMNLFTPQWLAAHIESRIQKLELYRLNDS